MRLVDLVPWRRFTIDTSWPSDVAIVEIQKRVDRPAFGRMIFGSLGSHGALPFVGSKVNANALKFSLQSSVKNPGRPVVMAVVASGHRGGSRIQIRMRIHLYTMAFMTVWMSVALLGAIMATRAAIEHGAPEILLAWGMPLLGAAFICVPFAFEARKSERLLRAIFEHAPALTIPPETGEAYR